MKCISMCKRKVELVENIYMFIYGKDSGVRFCGSNAYFHKANESALIQFRNALDISSPFSLAPSALRQHMEYWPIAEDILFDHYPIHAIPNDPPCTLYAPDAVFPYGVSHPAITA